MISATIMLSRFTQKNQTPNFSRNDKRADWQNCIAIASILYPIWTFYLPYGRVTEWPRKDNWALLLEQITSKLILQKAKLKLKVSNFS